jgi:hypothetical protein
MALIDHVYNDIGLADQFDDATDTLNAAAINGSTGRGHFYVGTPTSGNKIQAASDPGTDPIQVTIVDAAAGTGVDELDIKLATSEGALGSAVAGDPLNLPATINYGTPVAVWFEWDNSVGSGTYTEISLEIVARIETLI